MEFGIENRASSVLISFQYISRKVQDLMGRSVGDKGLIEGKEGGGNNMSRISNEPNGRGTKGFGGATVAGPVRQ